MFEEVNTRSILGQVQPRLKDEVAAVPLASHRQRVRIRRAGSGDELSAFAVRRDRHEASCRTRSRRGRRARVRAMSGAAFKIQRLGIEGFKAFAAPQSFDIGGGHVFVFGRNGLGKSSVVEAVRWCLFGLADRAEAEVRNVFYPAGECKVELELDGPGGRWTIQRRLRPGSGRSDPTIRDPSGAIVLQTDVFPGLARLGPREGTHIIFASQQSTRRRPQADITDFDKVLYSYLRIDDVPELLDRLEKEFEEQSEVERQLAEEVDKAEESLRLQLSELRSRIEEDLATAPWPGETVPTNAETDARIRAFVKECDGSLERADGGRVTREWRLEEAERAIQQLSAATRDTLERELTAARTAFEQLSTAKETFEDLTAQLKTAQARGRIVRARVEECARRHYKAEIARGTRRIDGAGQSVCRLPSACGASRGLF